MIFSALLTIFAWFTGVILNWLPAGDNPAILVSFVNSLYALSSYLGYVNTFLPVAELITMIGFAVEMMILVFTLKVINFIYRIVRGRDLFSFRSTETTETTELNNIELPF